LVGDFAFVYADILLRSTPEIARPVFDELRIELCVGQYLDLEGTASGSSDPVQAARIERYKSGKYTVERPLHLGAALAGRLDEVARSIERLVEQALEALAVAPIAPEARVALEELGTFVAWRDR